MWIWGEILIDVIIDLFHMHLWFERERNGMHSRQNKWKEKGKKGKKRRRQGWREEEKEAGVEGGREGGRGGGREGGREEGAMRMSRTTPAKQKSHRETEMGRKSSSQTEGTPRPRSLCGFG